MNNLYLVLLLVLLSFNSIAQNIEFEEKNFDTKENFDKAIKYLYQGDDFYADGIDWYEQALENYLEAEKLNPSNAALNYRIGTCYYQANNVIQSDKYIKKAYKLNPNVDELILYRLGQGAQSKLQFDNAIDYFTQFKDSYKGKKKAFWIEETDRRIKECTDGKDLMKNFVGGMVKNIRKVNSKYIDHSPLITNDEKTMFFTSRRPTSSPKDVDAQGRSFEDIYVARKDENGNWMEAENIGAPINTSNHDATVGVSGDGTKLYIYDGKNNKGDILVSVFENGVWSQPEPLPAPINTKYAETAISYSSDGKYVYFVTDRPGGVGQKDIWRAEVSGDNKYKHPKPLSSVINTEFNERAVFIHPDGKTMYFSSEGHKTMGGFDIFKSEMDEEGNWGEPQNIGYPVNTSGDDVFFVTSADNKRGYFSAVKMQSKGEQDIYMYVFPEKSTDSDFIVVRGVVKDESSKKPIPASLIFTDVDSGEKISIKADPKTGEFLASVPSGKNYAVNVTSKGYALHSESLNLNENKDVDFLLALDMGALGDCKPIVLKNLWFDFDKATIKSTSNAELDELVKFLKGCDQYNVEIAGYTCTAGPIEYNNLLSKRRAQAVVDYLVVKGVDKSRLTAKGYGPKNPIADNETKAGRIKNRRVEFELKN